MYLKNMRGATLLELVAGMAVMGIVIAGLAGVLSTSVQVYRISDQQNVNNQQARLALNNIAEEIRYATEITEPAISKSGMQIKYLKQGEHRVIKMGSDAQQNNIVINRITKTMHGGIITETETMLWNMGSGRVQNLIFTRDSVNNQRLTIALTIRDATDKRDHGEVLSTVVMMPNI